MIPGRVERLETHATPAMFLDRACHPRLIDKEFQYVGRDKCAHKSLTSGRNVKYPHESKLNPVTSVFRNIICWDIASHGWRQLTTAAT